MALDLRRLMTACGMGAAVVAQGVATPDAFLVALDAGDCLVKYNPTPNAVMFAANSGGGKVGEAPATLNYFETQNVFQQAVTPTINPTAKNATLLGESPTAGATSENSIIGGKSNTDAGKQNLIVGTNNALSVATAINNIVAGSGNASINHSNLIGGLDNLTNGTGNGNLIVGASNIVSTGANVVGGFNNEVKGTNGANVVGGSNIIMTGVNNLVAGDQGAGAFNVRGNPIRIFAERSVICGSALSLGSSAVNFLNDSLVVGRDNSFLGTASPGTVFMMGRELIGVSPFGLVIGTKNEAAAAPPNPLTPTATDLAFSIGTGLSAPQTGFAVRYDNTISLGDVAASSALLPAIGSPNLTGAARQSALAVVNNGGTRQLWFNNGTTWVQII